MDEDGALGNVFTVPGLYCSIALLFHSRFRIGNSPPETLAVGRIVSHLGGQRKVAGLKHRVRSSRAWAKPPSSLW
jgi:hypothetical protein